MPWIIVAILIFLIIGRLNRFLQYAKEEVSETIGEVVMASRMPSSTVSIEEMRSQDIHPYFCASEYKMVWVEHPNTDEKCPWCDGTLIPFS